MWKAILKILFKVFIKDELINRSIYVSITRIDQNQRLDLLIVIKNKPKGR